MPPRLASQFHLARTLPINVNRLFLSRRALHEAKADFITLDSNGSPTTRKLDIFIGDPHEAVIAFDKDVGFAMKSAIAKKTGMCHVSDSEKMPLTFFHASRHFAHGAIPYPRIVIERDLPRQNATDTSPATLWLWGASHSITLDGTPDYAFEVISRESHERLKGAAELLRNR
ncbi:hypothetical protein HRG_002951 [Hirsutella rhossiliensis]|uniref:Uncharacterized protein n=1 Tax=Hirsutella rhossiliensis TaxID=111463 RepID=A0A9P8N144_9HYPO|nr:uncharacterized protein HRG_02951 [Hirsutella rhossiliensis]KAH0964935.1 hypothetical protein HRG_02951 [Hirsutella rhossiliensis]